MKKKWKLFTGIVLLTFGIVMQKTGLVAPPTPHIFMLIGVLFKVLYIGGLIRSGEYKPGKEFYLLGVGLILFITGMILGKNSDALYVPVLKFTGILLKVAFIVLFIIKSKKTSAVSN